MKVVGAIVAVCAAFAFQASFSAAQAARVVTQCTGLNVTNTLTSDTVNSTTSTDWITLVDGLLNFTTSKAGCVIVTFSAPAYTNASDGGDYKTLHVRVVLDRNSLCVPANYSDDFSSAIYPPPITANSITRVCPNVGTGGHRVQVQFHSDDSTNSAVILSHVLTVAHR